MNWGLFWCVANILCIPVDLYCGEYVLAGINALVAVLCYQTAKH